MKKTAFILACALLLPVGMMAQKEKKAKPGAIKTYKDCYIYGQSGRNTAKKGSALDLSTGMTYSLENAIGGDIDVMMFFGKANDVAPKTKENNFYLFSPNNPNATIDWEKDGGTTPYCKFEGKSDNPDAFFALKNWPSRRTTKLVKVDDVDFVNATFESIDSIAIEDSYIVGNVKIGDIIAFQLEGKKNKEGKKGLILIKALENDDDPKQAANAGKGAYQRFIMDVKIQK